jgi:hypothetical protein
MGKLEIERDRVLPDLSESGSVLPPDELPDDRGLYALWPASEQSLAELGLENRADQIPLIHRPLYVGKAQDSIFERVTGKHLASGHTGHSSPRRSFCGPPGFPEQTEKDEAREPDPKAAADDDHELRSDHRRR